MLSITPDIEEAFEWFELTYELVSSGLGVARWHLARLPNPGSIGEQDNILLQTLEYIALVRNAMMQIVKPANG